MNLAFLKGTVSIGCHTLDILKTSEYTNGIEEIVIHGLVRLKQLNEDNYNKIVRKIIEDNKNNPKIFKQNEKKKACI